MVLHGPHGLLASYLAIIFSSLVPVQRAALHGLMSRPMATGNTPACVHWRRVTCVQPFQTARTEQARTKAMRRLPE
jgi:hypothetical protein